MNECRIPLRSWSFVIGISVVVVGGGGGSVRWSFLSASISPASIALNSSSVNVNRGEISLNWT